MNSILIFSPTPSHPQDAGNRTRIYNLASYLQNSGNKIFFVYYTQEGLTKDQHALMCSKWDYFIPITKNNHHKSSHEDYYAIDDWYEQDLGQKIQKIIINNKIDIVLCTYIFQSKIFEFIPKRIVKILDTLDKFSNRHIMLKKSGLKPDFFYTIPSEESIGLNRSDIVISIQSEEANFFKKITNKRVEILGHMDEPRFITHQAETMEKDILNIGFIGSTNTMNTISLKSFLEKFINIDASYASRINISIAGSVCSKIDIKNYNIKYLGFVESLDEFYKSVDLIINPLIIGTGLKIKTVEALSYGKPILSTKIGFEGIRSVSQFHNCDNAVDMMNKLITILDNKEQYLQQMSMESKEIFTDIVNMNNNKILDIFKKKKTTNILIITHINFWERDLGSRNRLYDMALYLKENMNITILYLNKRRKGDSEKIENIGFSSEVIFVEDIEIQYDISEQELNTFIEKHPILKQFANKAHYFKIANFIQNYKFDKVIIEYIHLSYFLPLFKDVDCYLDCIDILYQRNEVFKSNSEKHWIDISREEEFNLFDEYECVLSIQKDEYSFLRKNNVNTILVPYSFQASNVKNNETSKSVVFIGGDTVANKNSINWFIDNIWDTFVNSGYTLDIYGAVSSTLKKDSKKNIYPRGRIEDLNHFYANHAAIAINPVVLGGGLKIKNVEAIASGTPLLTTEQGAFGIKDGEDIAFLVARTIEEWKDKLTALMISKELRKKLSENAINYTKDNFQRDVCYKELTQLLLENGDFVE